MYARQVGDRELTFGVSGLLWEGSLIMIDQQTESLWSHLLGEAMKGPLVGEKLEVIPALMTDWETWKAKQPKTTVAILPRTANRYRRGVVADSAAFGVCYDDGQLAKAWPIPFSHIDGSSQGAINDTLGETHLLIYWDPRSETAAIYDRTVDGQVLTLRIEQGRLQDDQTQSVWDPILGRATEGPMQGAKLKSLPGVISEMSVWSLYYPGSPIWNPRQADN